MNITYTGKQQFLHPKLRQIVIIQLDEVSVRVLCYINIRLDSPGALRVITQTRSRVQVPDHVNRDLNMLDRSAQLLRNLFILTRLKQL